MNNVIKAIQRAYEVLDRKPTGDRFMDVWMHVDDLHNIFGDVLLLGQTLNVCNNFICWIKCGEILIPMYILGYYAEDGIWVCKKSLYNEIVMAEKELKMKVFQRNLGHKLGRERIML